MINIPKIVIESFIDLWEEKKNKNLIKERCYRGEEIGRKKRTEVDREKSVGREEAKGGDSESVRREKKQREEKKWESLLWKMSYALCGREIVFQEIFLENNL